MTTARAWQRMLSGRRLDLLDPSPEQLRQLVLRLGVSGTVVEDALAPHERAKVTAHADHLFFTVYATQLATDTLAEHADGRSHLSVTRISGIVLPPGGDSIDNNFGEIGDSPDLVVSKTATPAVFTVNNTATYTLRVRNIGQQPSAGEYVVEDRLPAGLTLAATPVGAGWTCTGALGDDRFRCASSTVIGAGVTSADTIVASVRVAATAATGSPVNNAVIVEGGGENEFRTPTPDERADFEGNPGDLPVCDPAITQNACRLPTPGRTPGWCATS